MRRRASLALAARLVALLAGALCPATLLVSACSFDRALGYRVVNACVSDEECATGLCYEGVCAAPPGEAVEVAVQVITGLGDLARAPASSVLPTMEIRDNAERDLTVSALARVTGQVRFRGNPVPALLSFTRSAAHPAGFMARVEVETGDPLGDGSADYVASLAANEEYELEVRVSGALFASTADAPELDESALASRQLPPLYIQHLMFKPGAHTFDVEFDPALFEPCDETRRAGCELQGTLVSVGLDDVIEPVSEVEVRAVDPASGRALSSSATVTDGAFALRIAPFDGEYDLQLVPSVGGSPYRATTFTAEMLALPVELMIRRYPVVEYVAVILDEETHEPVPLATVSFQSSVAPDPISGASAVYRTSALSGEGELAGQLRVELQPGVFRVVITPVETQDFAIHQVEVTIPDTDGTGEVIGQAFELTRRASLALYVEAFDGRPVDLAEVQATPRALAGGVRDPAEAAAFARSSLATTDDEGQATLPIDLAPFDLFARPSPERGFPHAFLKAIELREPGETQTHKAIIPPPRVLTGTVYSADGAPLGGATLRASVAMSDESGLGWLRVAETTSDADGSYRLLLPTGF